MCPRLFELILIIFMKRHSNDILDIPVIFLDFLRKREVTPQYLYWIPPFRGISAIYRDFFNLVEMESKFFFLYP